MKDARGEVHSFVRGMGLGEADASASPSPIPLTNECTSPLASFILQLPIYQKLRKNRYTGAVVFIFTFLPIESPEYRSVEFHHRIQ